MFIDILGWLAAAATFGSFAMKTMLPLRCLAIAANCFFISWSLALSLYPTLVLHAALLPFNLFRLYEIVRQTRETRHARLADGLPPGLKSYLRPSEFADVVHIFRQGDLADRIYFLEKGRIHLDEIGRDLEPGEMFGELAFFSEKRLRTLSARCVGKVRVLSMSEAEFMALFHQKPEFGFYVVKVIAQRLAAQAPAMD
jgi:CRP-like cAMP-binding protein